MRTPFRLLPVPLIVVAAPAAAQLRVVPEQPVSAAAARGGVDVFLINDGAVAVAGRAPDRIEVVALDGARLALVPVARPPASIAAQAFARVRYISAGVLSVGPPPPTMPAAGAPPRAVVVEVPVAGSAPVPPSVPTPMATTPLPPSAATPAPYAEPPSASPPAAPPAPLPPPPAAPVEPRETVVATSNGTAAGFLDRFMPYEPIYGAIGAGKAATKLQFSFALAPFGGDGALSHLRFAYTQTMFWATNRPSGPFRATTYSPEVFVEMPLASATRLAFGYAHQSNGEGDPTSIDVNRIYLRVAHGFDLGGGWRAELVPEAWVYVGRRGYTPDVKDYRGYTSLKASIGQDDGLKLSLFARGNPGTGRGAAELFASYPLVRLGDLGIYLFGQGFTGYGEALDDYRRKDSHARLGIALTR